MSNFALKQQKKAWIVDHAISMFTKNGYHSTSLSDVAKAIPIHTDVIYLYFSSKDDLAISLIMIYLFR